MARTYRIGELARECGLSRSTLLYYDSIGLLRPRRRSGANYRIYGEEDRRRLASIRRYREIGLTLNEVGQLLDRPGRGADGLLQKRLEQLNGEIGVLREQQRVIVRLLRNRGQLRRARALDKKSWVALLRKTGLDEEDMQRWHVEFERMAPEGHRDFLESLGIEPEEIRRIRRRSEPSGAA